MMDLPCMPSWSITATSERGGAGIGTAGVWGKPRQRAPPARRRTGITGPATNEAAEDDVAHPTGAGEGLPASEASSHSECVRFVSGPRLPDYARLPPGTKPRPVRLAVGGICTLNLPGSQPSDTGSVPHCGRHLPGGPGDCAAGLYRAVSVNEMPFTPTCLCSLSAPARPNGKAQLRVVTGTAKAAGLQHLLLADQQHPGDPSPWILTSRVPFPMRTGREQ
jgi:hypothetical protein